MRIPQTKFPVTMSLAGAATFSALAYLVSLIVPAAIQPPFPILFYLRFDPAEIIDISSLLIFGPAVGTVTATIHFLILTGTSFGILTRVLVMTIVNYIYFVSIAQAAFGVDYQGFARFVLQSSGFNVDGLQLVYLILGLTALYNGIHAILSIVASLVIVVAIVTRAPQMLGSRSWLTKKLLLVKSSLVTKENRPVTT